MLSEALFDIFGLRCTTPSMEPFAAVTFVEPFAGFTAAGTDAKPAFRRDDFVVADLISGDFSDDESSALAGAAAVAAAAPFAANSTSGDFIFTAYTDSRRGDIDRHRERTAR
jgi:hypothetical protein